MILKTEITPELLSKLATKYNINFIAVPTKQMLFEMLKNDTIRNWCDFQTHKEILKDSGQIASILTMAIMLKKTPSNYCEAFTDECNVDKYEKIDDIETIANEISEEVIRTN